MSRKKKVLSEKEVEVVLKMIQNRENLSGENLSGETVEEEERERIVDMQHLLEDVGVIEMSTYSSQVFNFDYDLTLYGQMLNKLSSTEILERLEEDCDIYQSLLDRTILAGITVLLILYACSLFLR